MAAPTIDSVYPVSGATGIVIGDQVKVYFDQEMDEVSINVGTFVVSGPDNDFIFGPDYIPLDEPGISEEDILSSPGTTGYVKGVISFQRVDSNGDVVSILDQIGDGTLYRTLAIFTPSVPLEPNKVYTILLAGDESSLDTVNVGISARTVFDTVNDSVSGTGQINFYGGYTGTAAYPQTYVVEIITAGAPGTAEYIWYKESTPLDINYGVTSTGQRDLEDGIYVMCDPDGSFQVGDTFKVVVKAPVRMANNYQWSFTTGSGSIEAPPSEEVSETLSSSVPLRIVSMNPDFRETNLDPASVDRIVITFNKTLDASTITDDTVSIWSESVNGDSRFLATGDLVKILSVDGNELTIQIG